jgi:hypothetical protein
VLWWHCRIWNSPCYAVVGVIRLPYASTKTVLSILTEEGVLQIQPNLSCNHLIPTWGKLQIIELLCHVNPFNSAP